MSGLNDPDLVPPGVLAEDAVAVVGKGIANQNYLL